MAMRRGRRAPSRSSRRRRRTAAPRPCAISAPVSSRTPNAAPCGDEERPVVGASGSSRPHPTGARPPSTSSRASRSIAQRVRTRHRGPRTWSACRSSRRPRFTQSATQSSMRPSGTSGVAEQRRRARSCRRAAPSALPGRRSSPCVPRRAASSCASQRIEIVSGPVTLIGVVGVVQCARQRSTCALASPCQMTLTWPIVTSTGSPRSTFGATSNEHAVAHVDRVVQAERSGPACRASPRSTRTCARGRGTTARTRRPAPAASLRWRPRRRRATRP